MAWVPSGVKPRVVSQAPTTIPVALMLWIGYVCKGSSVSAANGTTQLGSVAGVWAFVSVEPPSGLAPPAGTESTALVGVVTNSSAHASAFRAWCARVEVDATLVVNVPLPAAMASTGRSQGRAGNASIGLSTTVLGEPQMAKDDGVRVFVTGPDRTIPGFIDLAVRGGRSIGLITSNNSPAYSRLDVQGPPAWGVFASGSRLGVAHHVWDETSVTLDYHVQPGFDQGQPSRSCS